MIALKYHIIETRFCHSFFCCVFVVECHIYCQIYWKIHIYFDYDCISRINFQYFLSFLLVNLSLKVECVLDEIGLLVVISAFILLENFKQNRTHFRCKQFHVNNIFRYSIETGCCELHWIDWNGIKQLIFMYCQVLIEIY